MHQAWCHYRTMYDTKKIPVQFKIPDHEETLSQSWPKDWSGLELGKELYRFQLELDEDQDPKDDDVAHMLKDIDIQPLPSYLEFDQVIFPCLEVYQKTFGHTDIPHDFVVPATEPWPVLAWGQFPLGTKVSTLRYREIFCSKKHRDLLQHRIRDWKWEVRDDQDLISRDEELALAQRFNHLAPRDAYICYLLQLFFRTHGHLFVPSYYITPSKGKETPAEEVVEENSSQEKPHKCLWPEAAQNQKLGHKIRTLRWKKQGLDPVMIQELNQMGFLWHTRVDNWSLTILPALVVYQDVYGHLDFSQRFCIPTEDTLTSGQEGEEKQGQEGGNENPYPIYSYGMNLGKKMYNLPYSYERLPLHIQEELAAMGLKFYTRKREAPRNKVIERDEAHWFTCVIPALEWYQKIHGNLLVDRHFVVPDSRPWPQAIWSLHLGSHVRKLRDRKLSEKLRGKLEAMGFIWNVRQYLDDHPLVAHPSNIRKSTVIPAMKHYREVYQSSVIPVKYIVPAQDPKWPERYWGQKLGRQAQLLRNQRKILEPDVYHEMKSLGFLYR